MYNLDFNPVNAEQMPNIIQQSRQALVTTAQDACQRRLIAETFGVISMRLPMVGLFLITPIGASFEDIRNEDTCLIDATGNLQQGITDLKLPSETKFHLKCYMVRTDINAIVHVHPPHASAYALRGEVFELVTDTARSEIKEVLRVQCGGCISRFCGLCSCRTDIRTSYAGVNVLLLKEDGIVTLGASLKDVLDLADLAEQTARTASSSSSRLRI
jgi:ribulose-5-phosphate 4-epimerase/fuculose-1-phosphate aldolase